MEQGKPRHLITREIAADCGLANLLGDKSSLPEAVCINEQATLEDSFRLLTGSNETVVVTIDDSIPVGIIARQAVLKAMVRHDG